MAAMSMTLLDWRRRVAAMYADVRGAAEADPETTLARFRAARHELMSGHPDSPIPAPRDRNLEGLAYWDYDASMRFRVPVEPREPIETEASSVTGDSFALRRIGLARLPIGDLEVYWIDVYGGGVFVPFRDGTSGTETYAAGRYLLDTVKGADLGGDADGIILDFNYAYHPSCAYDPSWSCPLAPRANWLSASVEAGERLALP
jgi:hypothetical protein